MYKWLYRVLVVAGIALIIAYNVLPEVGVPKDEQRPVRIAFVAIVVLGMVLWVGRLFVRRAAPPDPDPPA
jgi:hypothetical protein